MIEINKMFHTDSGEIVFEDAQGQWWRVESWNPEIGTNEPWTPTVATKIDKPED